MKILQFPVCEDGKCCNRYLKWSIKQVKTENNKYSIH